MSKAESGALHPSPSFVEEKADKMLPLNAAKYEVDTLLLVIGFSCYAHFTS